ncbi:MAG: FapA family protein [Candidatus Ozemobacteraceae bacterium]
MVDTPPLPGPPTTEVVREPLNIGSVAPGIACRVALNKDKTEAYLSIEAYPETFDPFELIDKIKKAIGGIVTEGIIPDFWDFELDESIRRRKIFFDRKFAQATPAIPGVHATIDYKVPLPTRGFLIRPDGTCDFKNRDTLKSVLEGDILLVRTPPADGTPGKSVLGMPIPPSPAKDIKIIPQKNAISSINDNLEVIRATATGQLVVENRGTSLVVSVVPILVIPQDVDYSTGNINFKGAIEILGSVLTGFSVVATGNIIINGLIEPEAKVTAGGDLLVKKGIRGTGRDEDTCEVRAFGNVQALYAENARITAEGDMLFRSVMNCRLCSNRSIFVERSIIGGIAISFTSIEAGEIGNSVGHKTLVQCGVSHTTITRINLIVTVLADLKSKLAETEKGLGFISRRGSNIDPLRQPQLVNTYEKRVESLKEQIQKLEVKKADLAVTLLDENKASISATIFHPGTLVQILSTKQSISKEIRSATYFRKMPEERIDFRLYQPDKSAKSTGKIPGVSDIPAGKKGVAPSGPAKPPAPPPPKR